MIVPGSIIGHRYRIVETIGAGGMANVYLAINLTSRRQVAIKVLKEEFINDAEFLRRFEREAKAVLHLSHDNIVRAYGVGEAEGLPYIVLEYIEGQTLKQIVSENGPMPSRLAVSMGLQILDALAAAHSAGIIHRDVKPQNVIVTPEGRCMLTDFGIARDAESSTITFAGSTILGSVHYLSPEQAQGKPVSQASDLYSVGILLYELLTGQVPFTGDNSVAIALMHINDDPVPPIQLNPRIPPALNDVIMRALKKNLSERYVTAREMAKQLKRTLTEPDGSFAKVYMPEQPAASTVSAPRKRKRKKRFHATLKIGVSVAAILAGIITLFIILRGVYSGEQTSMEVVPVLTERTLAEAMQKADTFGFTLEVREYENSDSIPYGNIMLQSPESGAKAKLGSVIYVTISAGTGIISMPDLRGMTPDEATSALEAAGLHAGTTQYRVSDTAIGYVCGQSILAGSEVLPGSYVDIWISATSSSTLEMPTLTGEVQNLALRLLGEAGFSNVYVRYDYASNEEVGLVVEQQPLAKENVVVSAPVYLTVSGTHDQPYAADVAFNLDIHENDTMVMVTMQQDYDGFDYNCILYEKSLPKGEKIPVSFTAYAASEGPYTFFLYSNGVEQAVREITFIKREP